MGDKCEQYRKGYESHYLTAKVWHRVLHAGRGPYVMRFMPFAVPLALITNPTSGGTNNETLNDSCPDCYSGMAKRLKLKGHFYE